MEGRTIAVGAQVSLSVPATKEMMLVIRLTTAAVMARAGISADGMDDMKMAVEEAATCLMQASCIDQLDLCYERKQRSCAVTLSGVPKDDRSQCTQRQNSEMSDDELAVVRCILETMADEVTLQEERGQICSITLIKWSPSGI